MALTSHPARRGLSARRSAAAAAAWPVGAGIAALPVVLTVVLTVVGWVRVPPASGQAVDTTSLSAAGPQPALLARVTPDPLDPPQIRVAGVSIAGDGVDPETGAATVDVAFDAAFAVPREPWRVSVSVGDPSGERVRASLVSVGSAGVTGRVEQGDGVQWDDLGPTEVSAPGDGLVTLRVPVADAAEDAVLWVEAEATVDAEIDVSRTPTFALVDLLGARPGPALGTSLFAVAPDDPSADPVRVDVPGPTVEVVGTSLEVTTTAAVPTEVDGAAVVDVIDAVELAGGGPEAPVSRLEIDRRTGEVRLGTAGAEPFVAVPGTTPWLVTPPSPTAPEAPATVTFDLEALGDVVGGPPFDRATTRVGVSRVLALDDRRILDAAGVGGTLEWFDEALSATTAPAPPPPAAAEDGLPLAAFVLAGLVALAVVVVLGALLIRRRRDGEPRPIDRLDPAPASVAAGVVSVVPSAEPRPSPPVTTPPTSPPPPPTTPDPAPAASEPDDPLAAFLAEVDELSARVDRLGGADQAHQAGAPETRTRDGSGTDRPR
jgi:hypothetical protein